MKAPSVGRRLSDTRLQMVATASTVYLLNTFPMIHENTPETKSADKAATINVVIGLSTKELFSQLKARLHIRRTLVVMCRKEKSQCSNDDTLMRILGSPVDLIGLTVKGLSYSSSLCV